MNAQPALTAANLLDELQATLTHGTVARRVETLRRVTDLYLEGDVDYSDDQIEVFDDVFNCLVQNIESNARVLLAQRLAPVKAPPRIIHHLAFEDMIEIAAPVLSQSAQIDDATLIANARTKGQLHMMAISTRRSLSGAVTDVLVELGSQGVVQSTVRNPGAEFSDTGYSILVQRAERDDELAAELARRSIPRAQYLKMIAIASASVRAKLEAANPNVAADVTSAVKQATRLARSAPGAISLQTNIAHGLVRSLYEEGRITEDQVCMFADEQKFDELNQAIACLGGTTVETVEALMVESRDEGLLILAKVCKLTWPTVKAIIHMRDEFAGVRSADLDECRFTYERLRISTAQQVLRFHRMQQSTAVGKPPTA